MLGLKEKELSILDWVAEVERRERIAALVAEVRGIQCQTKQ
jgi:uncharacterized small protein (DUF1192 family)